MIKVILALIILVNGFFAYRLIVDLVRHKSEVRREYLVKSMDVDVIKWVVFVVVLYAALDLINKEFRLKKPAFQPNQ